MENQGFNEEAKAEAEAKKEESAQTETASKKDDVDYKQKYFYLAAEMDNYRKRMDRERESTLKFGNEKILGDMVDVVDNFERTIEMLRTDNDQKMKNVVVGLDMVKKMFLDSLSKNGLTQIESLGKIFDPNFHEAMGQESIEGKKSQEIVKEYQKGYMLNGRLLRAAKVIVNIETE